MGGETGKFRGTFLGGFNRQDVVNYIEHLSEERNTVNRECKNFREKVGEYEERIFTLEQENEELRSQLEAERSKNFAIREQTIDETGLMLHEMRGKLETARNDAGIDIAHAKGELERMITRVAEITALFEETDGRFELLEKKIAALRDEEGAEIK